jgi:predicted permease
MDAIYGDLRCAWRSLRASPGITLLAVLTLALGIGATTAIVSVCDALLLQPLPYPDSDQLVALRSAHLSGTTNTGLVSPMDLSDWQARATAFEAIAGYRWRTVDVTGGASSERLHGLLVTPEFFKVFGATRVNGRTFAPEDRGTNTIVLGRGVWERRFAADRALVGSMLDVNIINLSRDGATPHLLLGVVPDQVHFPPLTADFNRGSVTSMAVGGIDDLVDFWLPIFLVEDPRRDDRTLDVVARLRPGVTREQSQTQMDAVSRALAEAFPSTNRNWTVRVLPLRAQILGRTQHVVLWLLLATALVFGIACGNASTLLLSRGLARQREIAVRSALGASRVQIVRLFLFESLFIALAATIVGLGIMSVGIRLLAPWFPSGVPLIRGIGVNGFVLSVAVAIAATTAGVTGLVPAWVSSDRPAVFSLSTRGQSSGRRQNRVIDLLVASQVALTMVLLVSAGLLFKSAAHLLAVEPGFDSHNVLTMTISLPNNKFDWQHNVVFSRDVMNAVKTNPRVTDAAVIQGVPMRPGGFSTTFTVEGMPPPDGGALPVARMRVVSLDYFRVMHVPLIEGRTFDERDGIGERGHPKFVLVNRALADRYWPGEPAVGKRLRGASGDWLTVAGVVGDIRYAGLDSPPDLEIYLPEALFPQSAITLLIKTTTNPLDLVDDARARIARVEPESFVTDIRTMDGLIADSLASRWFATLLLAVCATLGLVLALSGIYGTVVQTVVQRRFDIGVRLALGATPGRVVGHILQRSAWPVVAGSIAGLIATFGVAQLLSSMLFDTPPIDPATFVSAAGLFVSLSLSAAFFPAHRATRIDPLVTLRCE